MKSILATAVALLASSTHAIVVFTLASEPNGQGIRKSWGVERWKCKDLAPEGFDNQASWAFVDIGLANGCELYDEEGCKGKSLWIEKNNSDILGPGAVNLTDHDFDKTASSFQCL